MQKSRITSIIIFALGISAMLGAESFQDFYFDLKSKYTENRQNYAAFSQFCGYTGAKLPWETEMSYRLRSAYNMLSAMMAMVIFASLLVGGFISIIFLFFKLTGRLK